MFAQEILLTFLTKTGAFPKKYIFITLLYLTNSISSYAEQIFYVSLKWSPKSWSASPNFFLIILHKLANFHWNKFQGFFYAVNGCILDKVVGWMSVCLYKFCEPWPFCIQMKFVLPYVIKNNFYPFYDGVFVSITFFHLIEKIFFISFRQTGLI